MRRYSYLAALLVLALAISACGGSAQPTGAAQSNQAGSGGNTNRGGSGGGFFGNQDPNAPLPLASALAVGTVKLDQTAQVVTPDEAQKLIPLWEGLDSLMSSDTAAQAEVEGVINQIQSTMTPAQVSAIKAMNLKGSDESSIFGQGGFGFRGGANDRGTPQAGVTPGAGSSGSRGGFAGGGGGGNFSFRDGGGGGGGFIFRGGGGDFGGPGGGSGAGLPGASSGNNSNNSSAIQAQRATAQARAAQFQKLGVNPILVRVVVSYLQSKSGSQAPGRAGANSPAGGNAGSNSQTGGGSGSSTPSPSGTGASTPTPGSTVASTSTP